MVVVVTEFEEIIEVSPFNKCKPSPTDLWNPFVPSESMWKYWSFAMSLLIVYTLSFGQKKLSTISIHKDTWTMTWSDFATNTHNKLQLIQYIGSANAALQQQCHWLQQLISCQLGSCRTDSVTTYKTLNKCTTQNSTWSLVAWFLQGQCKNNPATNTLLSGHEAILLVMWGIN